MKLAGSPALKLAQTRPDAPKSTAAAKAPPNVDPENAGHWFKVLHESRTMAAEAEKQLRRLGISVIFDARANAVVEPPAAAAPTASPAGVDSVRDSLSAWECERKALGARGRNAKKQAKRLRTLAEERGWISLGQIDRKAIIDALSDTAKKINPRSGKSTDPKTINTLLSQVSTFFEWCVSTGRANVNPAATIPRPKRGTKKGTGSQRGARALRKDEPGHLVRSAAEAEDRHEPRSLAYRVGLATGGRKDQITLEYGKDDSNAIRWKHVDFEPSAEAITYDDTKNGACWRIPIRDAALIEDLRRWRKTCEVAGPDDFVFPFKVHDRDFGDDLKAAGIAKTDHRGRPASFNSLRKTFCTALVRAKVHPAIARQLMQHKTLEMTLMVYTEVEEEDRVGGVEALCDFFNVGKLAGAVEAERPVHEWIQVGENGVDDGERLERRSVAVLSR